ncbi:MAG: PH domain-containing protein [Roseibium sp.]|uniref:PH domain-containing protein n=1 Tax=Roseibium sp. TaxID=1936156 RepID=UPI003299C894
MGKESNHLRVFKETKLGSDEELLTTMDAFIKKGTEYYGLFLVTNKRVCFYCKKMFGEMLETIPLEKITSVESGSGIFVRTLRLHTSHNDLEVKTYTSATSKTEFNAISDLIESHRGLRPMSASRVESDAAPVEKTSIIDQLSKLSQMKAAGDLSEEEFAAMKAQLMAQNTA